MSIEIEKLTHIYMKKTPFEKKALDNIDLKIDDNEFVGIIGHTGCGKSTLIQHFNGLLKPTSGKVIIDGAEVTKKGLKELREKVGLVFQYPEHQLFEETVYKDIAFGLKNKKLSEKEERERVLEAAAIVGIREELLSRSIFELSGGEKRRVAIAGIIVMQPSILILDEPTAGLDPAGRDEILSFVNKIYLQRKISVILVSHSMEDIAKLVRRVIVMSEGRIIMDGTPSKIFKRTDDLERTGLAAPQITYFMKELRKIYPDIRDDCFTVEQAKAELLKHLKGKNYAG